MEIITVYPRGFGANTYAITLDGKHAIIIDPAQPRGEGELIKRGLEAKYVLLTHCHFDHVGGVPALQASGAKVLCSAVEKPFTCTETDMHEAYEMPPTYYQVDDVFEDGEEKILLGMRVKMILTPGHTKGSACYLFTTDEGGRYLFTGDTLFKGSVGRTDFITGNAEDMRASIHKLKAIDEDAVVYPGHSYSTTLFKEKEENPFLK